MSTPPPDLLEILQTGSPRVSDQPPALGELRCEADILERIVQIGRFVRTNVKFAAGCPILQDETSGHAFAAAWGSASLALRMGTVHPGMLTMDPPHHEGLDDAWWNINPWPQDTTFQRGNDILRHAVQQAMKSLVADH